MLVPQLIGFDGENFHVERATCERTEAFSPTTHEEMNTTKNHTSLEVDPFPGGFRDD